MNELLFFGHVLLVLLFAFGALKLGKEALIAWVALQAILANLFVIKQIFFFGFEVTCSDVFAIGSILGLNLLQEYFGKESSKKAIWISFYLMAFFGVMSQMHLFYSPSLHDSTDAAFHTILSSSPRLLIASLGVFFVVQQCDMRFFGFLRQKLPGMSLWARNALSLTVSQLLDTVLFSFAGLYGMVESMGDIVIVSFLLKILIIACCTPLVAWTKRRIPS